MSPSRDRHDRSGDAVLARQINDAIAKGVLYLKAVQRGDGSWGDGDRVQSPGRTALALYALAASGVPKDDPAIARGLAFVDLRRGWYRESSEYATYSNALLVLALTRIDPVEFKGRIREAADRLVARQPAAASQDTRRARGDGPCVPNG